MKYPLQAVTDFFQDFSSSDISHTEGAPIPTFQLTDFFAVPIKILARLDGFKGNGDRFQERSVVTLKHIRSPEGWAIEGLTQQLE
jgi:hypothetical protein